MEAILFLTARNVQSFNRTHLFFKIDARNVQKSKTFDRTLRELKKIKVKNKQSVHKGNKKSSTLRVQIFLCKEFFSRSLIIYHCVGIPYRSSIHKIIATWGLVVETFATCTFRDNELISLYQSMYDLCVARGFFFAGKNLSVRDKT